MSSSSSNQGPTSHPGQTDAGMPKARRRDAKSPASESPLESGGTTWSETRPKERPGTDAASSSGDNAPIESARSLEGASGDAQDEATHSGSGSGGEAASDETPSDDRAFDIAPDERGDVDPRDD